MEINRRNKRYRNIKQKLRNKIQHYSKPEINTKKQQSS